MELPPDHGPGQEHSSKVMAEFDHDSLTLSITLECNTCGRHELHSIPILHLNTLQKVFETIADELGLKTVVHEQVLKEVNVGDEDMIADARRKFDALSIPDANNSTSPWDL